VTLSGGATSPQQARAAVEAARSVFGVDSVKEKLL
jgi:osmotically-inducible protein OsmY